MKKILFFKILCCSMFLNLNCSGASASEADAESCKPYDQKTSHPAALISADVQRQAELAISEADRQAGLAAVKEFRKELRDDKQTTENRELKQRIAHLMSENAGQRTLIGSYSADLLKYETTLIGNVVKQGLNRDIIKRYEGFIIGSGIDFVVVSCLENRLPSAHKQIFNSRDFAAVLSTVTGTVVKEVYYTHKGMGSEDNKELLIGGAVDVGCKFVGMKAVSAALFATNYFSKDCIDVEKHRGTIKMVQIVAGNALIFCAGPSLTDCFK